MGAFVQLNHRLNTLLVLSVSVVVTACADESEDRQRFETIQGAYSKAISEDFVASLHGEKVAQVLKALDGFEASEELEAEAAALARRIRLTQQRNPETEDEVEVDELFGGVGEEVVPEISSKDPTEAIWMKALKVGAFRAEFERYWLGCFQPVGGDVDRWRPLDVPPCRRRPGMSRIGEVRFKGGQISQLVTYEQLLKAAASDESEK